MSTRFTIYCEDHEVAGPHIRRHHKGAYLLAGNTARFFPDYEPNQASDDWGGFLTEHEFCDLRLKYELSRRKFKPEGPPTITHILHGDGTLTEQP